MKEEGISLFEVTMIPITPRSLIYSPNFSPFGHSRVPLEKIRVAPKKLRNWAYSIQKTANGALDIELIRLVLGNFNNYKPRH
jgi:hypothetical protein